MILATALQLTPDSTLADLPFHDLRVRPDTLGHEVAAQLEGQADLPGVIVDLDGGKATLISRRLFFQHMSRGFSREIYLRRPINVLLQALPLEVLRLPACFPIREAAQAALARPQDLVYEPILVEAGAGELRLLDAYNLLLAQNHLLTLANGIIQQQKETEEAANRGLREAQAALVQSEKLASLGQLAAGMAHEINNPVALVTNNLAVLEREMQGLLHLIGRYQASRQALASTNPALAAEIAQLEDAVDCAYIEQNYERQLKSSKVGLRRVTDIVRNLSDFARLQRAALEEVDLNVCLRNTIEMLRHEAQRRDVRLETDFEGGVRATAHPGKINQVFLNLLLNALQACSRGGCVRIRTRAEQGASQVEVEDTGCGIKPEHLPRVFEPFFTTKPVGQGTGLGLAVSYGIVREHGGTIEVESTLDRGSVFRVRLPAGPALGSGNGAHVEKAEPTTRPPPSH
jgi:signal transduction histidine kinase